MFRSLNEDNKVKLFMKTFDSVSSNKNHSIPILNNEQILVDWINTIRQPHCLLLNSLLDDDIIGNGIVFIEIISNFLQFFGFQELKFNDNLNKYEKLNLIILSLLRLNKGKYFNIEIKEKTLYFYNKIKLIFQNKNLLIEFIEFLKEIYEKYGLDTTNNNIQNQNINDNQSYDENDDINVFQDINDKSFEKVFSKKYHYNPIKQNKITNININLCNKKNIYQQNKQKINKSLDNIIYKQDNKNNLVNGNFNNKINNETPSINSYTNKIQLETKKNIFPSHRIEKNNYYNKIINPSLSPTHNISISISPSNKIKLNKTTKNIKINNIHPIEKNMNQGEINLTIGVIKKNLFNNINNNNNIYPIYNFYLPSKPILRISNELKDYEKFNVKVNKNIKLNYESIFQKEPIIKSPIKRIKKTKRILNEKDYLIKKWLMSLKIIPRNFSYNSILNLCYNGILYCEILNKWNKENNYYLNKEIMKKSYSISQNQLYLKKFFNSISSKHLKFKNSEELIQQLINKNEKIAFYILYELYDFYTKNYQKYIQTEKNKFPIHLHIEKNNQEEDYFCSSNRQNKSMQNIFNYKNYDTNHLNNKYLYLRNYSQDVKKKEKNLNLEKNNDISLNYFYDIETLNNDYLRNNKSFKSIKKNNNLSLKYSQINLKKGFLRNKLYKRQNTFNRKNNSHSFNYNKTPLRSPKCFLLFNSSHLNMIKDETKKFLKH